MDKFKCVECDFNEVEDENGICDDCFYDIDENEDMEEVENEDLEENEDNAQS